MWTLVEVSAVGKHVFKDQTHHAIAHQDFKFHDEISVRKIQSTHSMIA